MAIEGQLLYTGYKFGEELALDLYGYPADEDTGFEVLTATLTGSTISLADLLSRKQLIDMGHWLDRREFFDDMDGAIAGAEHDKSARLTDHLWRHA